MISLLLLTLMSLLGLGAMQAAQLEEKMASNFRFGVATFHAAEAGVEQAISNHTNNQAAPSITGTVNQSSYTATVSESGGLHTVSSVGTHPASGARQEITVQLSGPLGAPPSIQGWSHND